METFIFAVFIFWVVKKQNYYEKFGIFCFNVILINNKHRKIYNFKCFLVYKKVDIFSFMKKKYILSIYYFLKLLINKIILKNLRIFIYIKKIWLKKIKNGIRIYVCTTCRFKITDCCIIDELNLPPWLPKKIKGNHRQSRKSRFTSSFVVAFLILIVRGLRLLL